MLTPLNKPLWISFPFKIIRLIWNHLRENNSYGDKAILLMTYLIMLCPKSLLFNFYVKTLVYIDLYPTKWVFSTVLEAILKAKNVRNIKAHGYIAHIPIQRSVIKWAFLHILSIQSASMTSGPFDIQQGNSLRIWYTSARAVYFSLCRLNCF